MSFFSILTLVSCCHRLSPIHNFFGTLITIKKWWIHGTKLTGSVQVKAGRLCINVRTCIVTSCVNCEVSRDEWVFDRYNWKMRDQWWVIMCKQQRVTLMHIPTRITSLFKCFNSQLSVCMPGGPRPNSKNEICMCTS